VEEGVQHDPTTQLARVPEIIDAFAPYFDVEKVVRKTAPMGTDYESIQNADSYWLDKFRQEELSVQLVFLKFVRH